MSERFPIASYKEVAKVARKLGFTFYRSGKGSHEVWRRERDGRQTTIHNHGRKPIKRRTLKAMFEDMDITWQKFNELLKK